MKLAAFAVRNTKEMARDKLNVMFGIGFPLVLLGLLTLIQSNIPVEIFALPELTPGIAVFGLSFISLFSATLISKDRQSSFMLRLMTSPMTSADFILGYTLPLLPMAAVQSAVCLAAAAALGLRITLTMIPCLGVLTVCSILYIGIGLLCGTLLSDKQVGGICGALLTNLSAWLSGTWFSLDLVGGGFKKVAELLPFCHAVDAGRAALAGNWAGVAPELAWVVGWAAVVMAAAVAVFRARIYGDRK